MSASYLTRRLLGTVAAFLVVVTAIFVILRIVGEPTVLLSTYATAKDVAEFRHRLGLDLPVHKQYLNFLDGVFTGQFGVSYRYGQPAVNLVIERLPFSLALGGVAFALAVLIAVPTGVLSAVRRGSFFDYGASVFSILGFSVPTFWLGSMAILVFSVWLGWLPTSGIGSIAHLVLPAATLATWPLGQLTRMVRSEMLSVLGEGYVRTARAKGLSERVVIWKHALKGSALAMVTLMALLLGAMLGGAIITETIFAWPGLGLLLLQSIEFQDFPVLQATVVWISGMFLLINLVVDMCYILLDPRIRYI